jgi:rod shape-determining protein MreC
MLELIKRNRTVVAAGTVLTLLVLLLSLRWSNTGTARWIDEAVQAVVYPFQAGFTGGRMAVTGLVNRYIFLVNVKEENDRLKLQVKSLEEQLNHSINSAVQFNLLREQLNFLEENPDRKVFAEVIGESADNFHQVLLINKGKLAGIRRNFPVVLREGVVGRIQSATALQSIVELIVDRRHRFPVTIQRSRERMVLQGAGDKLELQAPDRGIVLGTGDGLRLDRIRMLADVQAGDRVITSGLDGIFPKGLLIGTVTAVSREKHELFQTAEVQPVVDFRKIEGVFVILRERRNSDFPMFSEP